LRRCLLHPLRSSGFRTHHKSPVSKPRFRSYRWSAGRKLLPWSNPKRVSPSDCPLWWCCHSRTLSGGRIGVRHAIMRFFAPRGHFTGRFQIEISPHYTPGEVIAAAERQICIRSSQNRMFHPDLLCFHQFRGRFLDPQLAIPIHDSPSMDNEQRSTSNSNMQWHNGFGCRWASSLSPILNRCLEKPSL